MLNCRSNVKFMTFSNTGFRVSKAGLSRTLRKGFKGLHYDLGWWRMYASEKDYINPHETPLRIT